MNNNSTTSNSLRSVLAAPLVLSFSALVLFLSGCLPGGGPSAPTHFYRLDWQASSNDVTKAEVAKIDRKILVKVSAAPAVRASSIVLAQSDYELNYSDTRRWAEAPEVALSRLLINGLRERYLRVEGIPLPGSYRPDITIKATVEKLWGTVKGVVVLQVSWQILDADGAIVGEGTKSFSQSGWKAGDYESLAARISQFTPALVQAIDESIKNLK
jgi:uncharacterized lipoprotein YmbA